jgi:hypothetical protein
MFIGEKVTALNFVVQEKQICIATDTLSIAFDDKKPFIFTTKYIVLPHVQTVVSGTGHGRLIAEWMSFVRDRIIATDIDHLNQYVPDALIKLSKSYDNLNSNTATIYHFGYSDYRQRYLAYAYRSTSNWKSEEILEGVGIKPAIDYQFGECFELPRIFIELMEEQRTIDNELVESKRIGIGGDIHFIVMSNGNINISKVHRFSSYNLDYKAMCENQQKLNNGN